jgi:hypothetical protein
MRGKFNYPLFIARIIIVTGFLALSIMVLTLGPSHWSEGHDLSGVIGLTITFTLLLLFVNVKFIRAVWTERFGLRIERDSLIITDHLRCKRQTLQRADIKGFSLSEYPLRGLSVKSILLYLSSGKKIELPQFLFFNFKQLPPALEQNGIKFLGKEPYSWKWIDSRTYKYDQ